MAILGAGIAGLVSADELRKAGFDCTVLEARDRPGGRNWTIRRGARIEFSDGSVQTCAYDEGLYLNAGPGRIPSIHHTILGYCRELGVPMEVEGNTSRGALLESDSAFAGRPVELGAKSSTTRVAMWPSCWRRPSAKALSTAISPRRTGSASLKT